MCKDTLELSQNFWFTFKADACLFKGTKKGVHHEIQNSEYMLMG